MKASESETSKAVALKSSVVDDLDYLFADYLRELVTNWIDIEDDGEVIAVEIEETMEELEKVAERDDIADASGVVSAGKEDEEANDDRQDTLPSFLQVRIESNYLSTQRFAEYCRLLYVGLLHLCRNMTPILVETTVPSLCPTLYIL